MICETCIYRNRDEYHKPCIVRRDNCEYYEKERGDMTREEAKSIMNVIVHMLEPQYDTDRIEDAVDMAIKALEQEPKIGHWIGVNPMVDTLMCSECGENIISEEFKSNYCPNCGAKMVEPQESEE